MTLASLSTAFAAKVPGYRAADGYVVDADHVARWVYQFDEGVREPLLSEMIHVADATYFSEQEVGAFFRAQISHREFSGEHPEQFWRSANILNIQGNGQSQAEISNQFFASLSEELGLSQTDCGQGSDTFVYLDDAVFSGSRAGNDLVAWVKDQAPISATVKILVIAVYRLGEYHLCKRLKEEAQNVGKDIKFELWAAVRLENRRYYKNTSEVLWPKSIPDDSAVQRYLALGHKFPFQARTFDGKLSLPIFSSPQGRELLETEMLKAGTKIREFSQHPSDVVRPLGFGAFGLGFGATLITYRNCPNNCPLAWWWGDPSYSHNHPFSKWYPLLQRKTYGGVDFNAVGF